MPSCYSDQPFSTESPRKLLSPGQNRSWSPYFLFPFSIANRKRGTANLKVYSWWFKLYSSNSTWKFSVLWYSSTYVDVFLSRVMIYNWDFKPQSMVKWGATKAFSLTFMKHPSKVIIQTDEQLPKLAFTY